jgi:hypothetical protein
MFLRLPFGFELDVQQLALILNTVLLIAVLVTVELAYAEATTEKRRELRYFLPIILVISGILVYAVATQSGSA